MFLVYIADNSFFNGYCFFFLFFLVQLGFDRKLLNIYINFNLIVSLMLNNIKLHIINLKESARI